MSHSSMIATIDQTSHCVEPFQTIREVASSAECSCLCDILLSYCSVEVNDNCSDRFKVDHDVLWFQVSVNKA